MFKIPMIVVVAAGILSWPALAADIGNAQEGRDLATRSCSGCHAVEAAPTATDGAPPFSVIARDQRENPALVRSFLLGMHAPMQDFALTRQQIEDVIAYLNALPAE